MSGRDGPVCPGRSETADARRCCATSPQIARNLFQRRLPFAEPRLPIRGDRVGVPAGHLERVAGAELCDGVSRVEWGNNGGEFERLRRALLREQCGDERVERGVVERVQFGRGGEATGFICRGATGSGRGG